eukprot:scaffold47862_cov28-Tisochrysis_lutea.AAC.2
MIIVNGVPASTSGPASTFRWVSGGKRISSSRGKTEIQESWAPSCMKDSTTILKRTERSPCCAYRTATRTSLVVDMGAISVPPLLQNSSGRFTPPIPRHNVALIFFFESSAHGGGEFVLRGHGEWLHQITILELLEGPQRVVEGAKCGRRIEAQGEHVLLPQLREPGVGLLAKVGESLASAAGVSLAAVARVAKHVVALKQEGLWLRLAPIDVVEPVTVIICAMRLELLPNLLHWIVMAHPQRLEPVSLIHTPEQVRIEAHGGDLVVAGEEVAHVALVLALVLGASVLFLLPLLLDRPLDSRALVLCEDLLGACSAAYPYEHIHIE